MTNQAYNLVEVAIQLRQKGNIDESTRLLNEATRIDSKNSRAWEILGHIAYKLEEYKNAATYYLRTIETSPSPSTALYIYLGNSYRQLGQDEEAIRMYNKVLELNSSDVDAKIRIAHIHFHKKRFPEAIAFYKELLTENPTNREAQRYLCKSIFKYLTKIANNLANSVLRVLQVPPHILLRGFIKAYRYLCAKYLLILEGYIRHPILLLKKHKRDLFTIIIQGPLNETSIKNIPNYFKYGHVIVSHWDTDSLELKKTIPQEVICISQPFPPPEINRVINPGSIYYIAKTMIAGLKLCDTPFVIKVRSDESYSDLKFLCNSIANNPEHWTTTNIWFRKDHHYKFHPCDHIIGTSTHLLLSTYNKVLKFCEKPQEHDFYRIRDSFIYLPETQNYPYTVVCESITCIAFLQEKGEYPAADNSKELMKKHFKIIPLPLLGRFLWASGGFQLRNQTEPFPEQSITSMRQI